jgi:hypothetical protein
VQPDPIEWVGKRAPRAVVLVVVGRKIAVLLVRVTAPETLGAPITHDDRV